MIISDGQANAILRAFDRLQMEDFLSDDQWRCAIAIMDFYPFLNQAYFYMRDRYDEQKLCEQKTVDSSSMGTGLHSGSGARDRSSPGDQGTACDPH